MKSIDFFCASPASTAICSSMDKYSMVRHGMRHIDRRHTQRLGDRRQMGRRRAPSPCPSSDNQKGRKSSAKEKELRRKSSADVSDLISSSSSRYLLSDKPMMIDFISDAEHISAELVPYNPIKDKQLNTKDQVPAVFRSSSVKKPHDSHVHKSNSSTPTLPNCQVVELRVSIHCKGCEGKVRKHLSRMEGVTSFSIDFASKKVTVIGDVTPLGVLASISKVKNAQFWPSPANSSSSSLSSMSSGRA